MKKYILFFAVFIICILNTGWAQCAFEQYHKIGGYISITDCAIIEDVSSKSTFTFWDSTIDTADHQTQENTEIWIVKNDSCGNRLWKKNFSYGEFTMDYFGDVILTPDSNFLIVGYSEFTGQGAIYNTTAYKINREGQVLWKKVYGGHFASVPSSVAYNPYRNTYLISGRIERQGMPAWSRAYVFEIDSSGNKLNEQDIIPNNDSLTADHYFQKMVKVISTSDSSILGIVTSQQADSIYLIKFTPNLEISWIRKPFEDLFSPIRGVSMNVDFSESKQELAVYTGAEKIGDERTGEWIIVLDTDGNILRSDFITDIVSPNDGMCIANDGEYLFWGDYLMRLDENFNFRWKKTLSADPYTRFTQVIQLKSGAYIGCGTSGVRINNEYVELFIKQSHPNGGFVGVEETATSAETINIYPNPSNGLFTIAGLPPDGLTATVMDITGKVIYKNQIEDSTFDLSQYPKGFYYLEIMSKEGNLLHRQKIVVQR